MDDILRMIKEDSVKGFLKLYYNYTYQDDLLITDIINNNAINILTVLVEDEDYDLMDLDIYNINTGSLSYEMETYLKKHKIDLDWTETPVYASIYNENQDTVLELSHNNKNHHLIYIKEKPLIVEHIKITKIKIKDNIKLINYTDFFSNLKYVKTIQGLENLDLSIATTTKSMFKNFGFNDLEYLNLGNNFNTVNVINMNNMFENCGFKKLKELSLGNKFNTKNVISMNRIFYYCGHDSLIKLDLGSNFNTLGVNDMKYMFNGCGEKTLMELNLTENFSFNNNPDCFTIFDNINKDINILFGNENNLDYVREQRSMIPFGINGIPKNIKKQFKKREREIKNRYSITDVLVKLMHKI